MCHQFLIVPARQLAIKLDIIPAANPMITAEVNSHNLKLLLPLLIPQTAPTEMPIADGLPFISQSIIIQATAAAAAAKFVAIQLKQPSCLLQVHCLH